MEIAVDSNIVFSAMISDRITRETLLDSGHKFYSPEFIQIRNNRTPGLDNRKIRPNGSGI